MVLLLIPLLFGVLGGVISYFIARAQGLSTRGIWAAVVGGVVGGVLGGFLTVPALGLGATVTAALATTVPTAPAAVAGTVAEIAALGVGAGVASGVGQASSNIVNDDPLSKDVVPATVLGGGLQVILGPIGSRSAVALMPGVAHALARMKVSAASMQAARVFAARWGGESTTEALTDGGTMVVPMPDLSRKRKNGPTAPNQNAAPAPAQGVGLSGAIDHSFK